MADHPANAARGINKQINYQGKLLNATSAPVSDGVQTMKFSIYDAESGGNRLWTAAGTLATPTAINVTTSNSGLFSILLGSGGQNSLDTVDWNQPGLYLGVTVAADSEMAPRKRFGAVSQAFNAERWDGYKTASSVQSGEFVLRLSQTSADAATSDRTTLVLTTSGTSPAFDLLFKGRDQTLGDVFTISRQGHTTTTGNLGVSGNSILGDASSDSLVVIASVASNLVPDANGIRSLGTTLLRWNGFFQNVTSTYGDFTYVTSTNVSSTSLFVSTLAQLPTQTTVGGQSVCLSNGTNCNGATGGWTYDLGNDLLRPNTNTTDLILGGTFATTSPLWFKIDATSTRFYFGAFGSSTNIVLGGTTSTITNIAFQLDGNDLYVAGNIGSASSVYTNGAYFSEQGLITNGVLSVLGTGTSTFAGAVSSTRGEFSNSLSVGGVNVCLSSGTNCPSTSSGADDWMYSLTNDFVRPNTNTTSLVLGASTVANAPFWFRIDSTSSRLYLGAFGSSTNVVLGGPSSTIVNPLFQLDGNDLFIAGSIGSASSVYTNGAFIASSTSYGSQFISNSNATLTISSVGELLVTATSTFTKAATVIGRLDAKYLNMRNWVPLLYQTIEGRRATTTVDAGPRGIAFDGSHLWVANGGADLVTKIDPLTNAVVATTTVGSSPQGVAFDGSFIWVTNNSSADVSKVDITRNQVVATVTVETGPYGASFDGTHLWVANSGSDTVSKIDVSTNSVVATVGVGDTPVGVAFDGSFIWVSNFSEGTLSKIDITSNTVVATTTVGGSPNGVAFDGSHLWVANGGGTNVNKVDITSNTVVATTTVGSDPQNMVYDGQHVWVVNGSSDTVSKIDVTTNSVAATYPVGSIPSSAAFDGTHIWVTNAGGDTVSKLPYVGGGFGNTFAVNGNLTVGGQFVCLANGTNCMSSGGWVYDAAGDFLRPATSTTGIVLGGVDPTTSPLWFRIDPTSTRFYFGAFGSSTDIVLGAPNETISESTFALDGNDLFVAGNIGSDGSIYTNGSFLAGVSMLYGDGFITRTSGNIVVSSTNGNIILNPSINGNVGVGTSTPSEKLTVVGNIQNTLDIGQAPTIVGTAIVDGGSGPRNVIVQGQYAYVTNGMVGTMNIIDVTEPSAPVVVGTSTASAQPSGLAVSGRYAYVLNVTSSTLDVIDVGNPSNPVLVGALATETTNASPQAIVVNGRYAYVVNFLANSLNVIDITNPAAPFLAATTTLAARPREIVIQGNYAYIAHPAVINQFSVVDISNPITPRVVGILTSTLSNPQGVAIEGRYAYLTNANSAVIDVIDVVDPTTPTIVGTVQLATNASPRHISVHGRYAYVVNNADSLNVIDVSSPTAPFLVASTTLATGADPRYAFVSGRYAYVANQGVSTVSVIDVHGMETNGLIAHSAEFGSMQVLTNAVITNNLTVGTGLNVGQGGILSSGSLAVSATNTTSTFAYAVSSTRGIFDQYVLVQNQLVCLADGTNCPTSTGSATDDWTYSATNDFLRPNTNTTSLVLGASTVANAPFWFRINSSSSRLYLGAFGSSTNLVLGGPSSTISNSLFQLDGNDLYVAGNIGSASSVYTNGAFIAGASTFYGDGFITRTSGNIVVSSSDANIILNPSINGKVGIGTSTPSEKLTVVGNVQNTLVQNQTLQIVGSTTTASTPYAIAVRGAYAYITDTGTNSLGVYDITNPAYPVRLGFVAVSTTSIAISSDGNRLYVASFGGSSFSSIDVSNPSSPRVIATIGLGGSGAGVAMSGRYAYVTNFTANTLHIIDVGASSTPSTVSTITIPGGSPSGVTIQGKYVYVTAQGTDVMQIVDVSDPLRPTLAGSLAVGSDPYGVAVQGRYVYVANQQTNNVSIIDVANANQPLTVATATAGGLPVFLQVSGRYVYVSNNASGTMSVIDVASSTLPVTLTTTAVGGTPNGIDVAGRYAYIVSGGSSTLNIIDITGIETNGLVAHSAEFGSLQVLTNGTITNNLTVGSGLMVGLGGILSAGSLAVSATNTTSTFMAAVSSTRGIFDQYILVNGQQVCLANGTNCPASSGGTDDWTYSATNDFVRPNTNTTSLVLGASTVDNAPFWFKIMSSSSRFYLGAFGSSTNVVIGGPSSTISNSLFQLDGNDLFVAGNIGSASSVYTNGAFISGASTYFGDGFITKTTAGNMTVSSTNGNILLNPQGNTSATGTLNGYVVVGTSTSRIYEKLTVGGNVLISAQIPFVVGATTTGGNANEDWKGLAIAGKYAFIAVRNTDRLIVVDISDPRAPTGVSQIRDTTNLDGAYAVDVNGKYAYVVANNATRVTVVDISKPSTPTVVNSVSVTNMNAPEKVRVHANFLYVYNNSNRGIFIFDLTDPTTPVLVNTINNGALFGGQNEHNFDIDGNYLYTTGRASGGTTGVFGVIDISNPYSATSVGSVTIQTSSVFLGDVKGRGSLVYGTSDDSGSGTFFIFDVKDPTNPKILVESQILTCGTRCRRIELAGRYAYIAAASSAGSDAASVSVVDIASTTNPFQIGRTGNITQSAFDPGEIVIKGKYLYMVTGNTGWLTVLDVSGIDSPGGYIGSLETDGLWVAGDSKLHGRVEIMESLTVEGSGIQTSGGLTVAATTTLPTNTTVGGSSVCTANGTNCPTGGSGSDDWTYSLTNDFIRPNTNTTSIVIGSATVANAPFWFKLESTSSRLYLGAFGSSTNIVLGAPSSTISNSLFQLVSSTLFVAGNIGSASSVYTNGAFISGASTFYGDGFITRTSGDLMVSSSNANIILNPSINGRVGIGTSTPAEKLTVVGNIQNTLVAGQSFTTVTSTFVGPSPRGVALQGKYAYVTTFGNDRLSVVDVSDPRNPTSVGFVVTAIGGGPSRVAVAGRYAYVADQGTADLAVVDVSNPATPSVVSNTTLPGAPFGIAVSGRFAYVTGDGNSTVMSIVDIGNPLAPTLVTSTFVGSDSRDVVVQGNYAYIAVSTTQALVILDMTNPARPVIASSTYAGVGPFGVAVQGRYAYVANVTSGELRVIDVSNPYFPITMSTLQIGTIASGVAVGGRYVYVGRTPNSMSVVDVSSSTNPVLMGNASTDGLPIGIALGGRYAYVLNNGSSTMSIVDVGGLETNGLIAHSAEVGTLQVRTNGTFYGQLSVVGGITIGASGILSTGAIGVSATNTTSTFQFAVSSSRLQVSNYATLPSQTTVGGVNVCLANGTNCPSNVGGWTYSATNDFLRPNSNTTSLVLGSAVTAFAPFYFRIDSTSSRFYLGAFGSSTNVVIGAPTSTITNSLFQLVSSTLFVAGNIGSASSVYTNGAFIAGPGSTYYGDGFISKTNGDLVLSANLIRPLTNNAIDFGSASRSWANIYVSSTVYTQNLSVLDTATFIPATNTVLTRIASYNNLQYYGIAVQGRSAFVQAIDGRMHIVDFSVPTAPVTVGSSTAQTSFVTGGDPSIAVAGKYVYTVDLSGDPDFVITDVSTSSNPVRVGSLSVGGGSTYAVTVNGAYAYVLEQTNDVLVTIDISDPTNPRQLSSISMGAGADPSGIAIQGAFAYVTNFSSNTLSIIDLHKPTSPLITANHYTIASQSNTAPISVVVQDRYAYVANSASSSISVVDISNPNAATTVKEFVLTEPPTKLEIAGRYLYAKGTNTVFVIDIMDPQNPYINATANVTGLATDLAVSGRYLLVTNSLGLTNNLQVYDLKGIETNAIQASLAEFGKLNVRTNVTIGNNLNVVGSLTVGGGGIFINDSLTVQATATFGNVVTYFTDIGDIGKADRSWHNLYASGTVLTGDLVSYGNILANASTNTTYTLYGHESLEAPMQSVGIQGRIAYLAGEGYFYVVDVTNPANPTVLATSTGYGQMDGSSRNIAVAGRYVYLTNNDVSNGFVVVDVSTSTVPSIAGQTTLSGSFAEGVVDAGNYAFVAVQSTDAVSVVDVSNPMFPTEINSITLGGDSDPSGLALNGRFLYVANSASNTLSILNVGDPRTPIVKSSIFTSASHSNTGPRGVAAQGSYVYVTNISSSTLSVINVATSTPVLVAELPLGSISARPQGITVAGRYAYVAMTASGTIAIVDISVPSSPALYGSISAPTTIKDIAVSGRYLYGTNASGTNAFSVYDIKGTETAGLFAHSAEVGSLSVMTNASIADKLDVVGSLTVGNAAYIQNHVTISDRASSSRATLIVNQDCGSSISARLATFSSGGDDKVSIRCNGQIFADSGTIGSGGDYAEYFYSSDPTLVSGDVVVFDHTTSNTVTRGQSALRPYTIGVVSTNPVVIGNGDLHGHASATLVGLLGQISTRVDASTSSIAIGDVVMASENGTAVKAVGPGMVLGTALESLATGTGRLMVHVSPHWWAGDLFVTTSTGVLMVGDLQAASSTLANASSTAIDSPFFSFQGSAWNTSTNAVATSTFLLRNDILSASTSLLTIAVNTTGTNLFTLNQVGDMAISGRFYPGNTGSYQSDRYIFYDGSSGPGGDYMRTNAAGWGTGSYDFAEMFPSSEPLEPGDIVVVDLASPERVKKSSIANQGQLVGIVSTRPGFLAGDNKTGDFPIALAGRVPTKVSTVNGAIKIGDSLVASAIPGVAMKATAPGPSMGVALEDWNGSSVTTVIAYVNVTFFVPDGQTLSTGGSSGSSASPRSGLATIKAGDLQVDVTFESIGNYPNIQVTPYGIPVGGFGIHNVTDRGFTIVLLEAQTFDLTLGWNAEPSPTPATMSLSDGTSVPYNPMTGETTPPGGSSQTDE